MRTILFLLSKRICMYIVLSHVIVLFFWYSFKPFQSVLRFCFPIPPICARASSARNSTSTETSLNGFGYGHEFVKKYRT